MMLFYNMNSFFLSWERKKSATLENSSFGDEIKYFIRPVQRKPLQ